MKRRRRLLSLIGVGMGSVCGCLRLSQDSDSPTNTKSTVRASTGPPSPTTAESQSPTNTESPTDTESPTATDQIPEYPEIGLEKASEIGFNSPSSDPATKTALVGENYLIIHGGKAIRTISLDSFSVIQEVPIPNVRNWGAHGLSLVGRGEIYATVGGENIGARVKRVDPTNGEVWSFTEDAFGPGVSRSVHDPAVTNSHVVFTVSTTSDRDNDNKSHVYVLDRDTGDPVEEFSTESFEDSTCYVYDTVASENIALLIGFNGYYFYNTSSFELKGPLRGNRTERLLVENGVAYGSRQSVNIGGRSISWNNNLNKARDIKISGPHVYSVAQTVNKVDKTDGTINWSVTTTPFTPHQIFFAKDSLWVTTDSTENVKGVRAVPGRIMRLDPDSGNILGARAFSPESSSLIYPYPFEVVGKDGFLYVGSDSGLLKYRIR